MLGLLHLESIREWLGGQEIRITRNARNARIARRAEGMR